MSMNDISIHTQDPAELSQLVKLIDPELEFVKDLHPDFKPYRTLRVSRGAEQHVLKVRHQSSNIWEDTYFYYEIQALRRVEERKLSQVVRLEGEYKTDAYHAILKTFAEGTPLNQLDHEALLLDEDFIKRLDALYLKLHLAGIAKIRYQPRKFVIAPNGEPNLVDLATCLVNTEVGVQIFSQEMRADSRFINRLEKKARQASKASAA